jgi:type VI secretion system ImpM family protein
MSGNQVNSLCFGKLPAFGDFVRYNAAGKEIQSLDQWFQEGLLFAKTRLHPNWDLAYKRAPGYRFIFPFRNNQKSLAGLFQSSVDKIGRTYPFILALLIDNSFIPSKYLHLAPVFFNTFMEKADILLAEATQEQALQNIPDKVEALGTTVIQSMNTSIDLYNNFKNGTLISQYISRMSVSTDSARKILLFENIIEQLKLMQKYNLNQLNYGLRLPLGIDFQFNIFEATFWLDILGRLFPQYSSIPSLFYTANGPFSHFYLYVFFNSPSPKNYVNLIQVDLEIDSIYKLDSLDVTNPKNPEHQPFLDFKKIIEENQSLNDFLEKFA